MKKAADFGIPFVAVPPSFYEGPAEFSAEEAAKVQEIAESVKSKASEMLDAMVSIEIKSPADLVAAVGNLEKKVKAVISEKKSELEKLGDDAQKEAQRQFDGIVNGIVDAAKVSLSININIDL